MVTTGGLEKLFELLEWKCFRGVAEYHLCPVHRALPLPHVPRTLRIFPTSDGDFVFRCHHCGQNWDTLELARTVLHVEWEAAAAQLLAAGVIERAYTTAELRHHCYLQSANEQFARGHRRWIYSQQQGAPRSWFGDWAELDSTGVSLLFPRGTLPSLRQGNHLIRRRMNIFGRTSGFVFSHNCAPATSYSFSNAEPVELSASPWAAACDWNEIILCLSMHTATRVERCVWQWPAERRLPVVLPERYDCWPLVYSGIFERVWLVLRENESVNEGLLLWKEHQTSVRVLRLPGPTGTEIVCPSEVTSGFVCDPRLPEIVPAAAHEVVFGTNASSAHRLSRLLQASWIPREAQLAVLQECSCLTGVPVSKLIEMADVGSSPYAVRSQGRLFVGRGGRYLMQDTNGRWSEVSNFTLRLTVSETDAKGNLTCALLLTVEGKVATFTVTGALLDNHVRLWKEARRQAALGGLPLLEMSKGQHRALLPSLIKKTAV